VLEKWSKGEAVLYLQRSEKAYGWAFSEVP